MKKLHPILLAFGFCLLLASCRHGEGRDGAIIADPALIDALVCPGEPFRLCEQTLTSSDGIAAATPDFSGDYVFEITPAAKTLYFPADDIRDNEIVKQAQLLYNSVAVANRVIHGYDLFVRLSTDVVDTPHTLADTLEWVKVCQPRLPMDVVAKAISDPEMRLADERFCTMFSQFKGDSSEGSELTEAFCAVNDVFSGLDMLVEDEYAEEFEATFWSWYDKRQFVKDIDGIIALRLEGSHARRLTEEQLAHFKSCVEGEKDIDRRAVLALEYAKHSGDDGAVLLGEIIESGIYTRYLLETWISWRAHVQGDYNGFSSMSVIPNNYYDMMRVKCIDTILRHYLAAPDKKDLALLENFILVEILHRQDSVAGNQAIAELALLDWHHFIDPRLLPEKETEED